MLFTVIGAFLPDTRRTYHIAGLRNLNSVPAPASFPRRLAALAYDTIAVVTVMYFASFIPVIAAEGKALASGNPLFAVYLIGVTFGYFGTCWTRGRTLGMQAWKLDIESVNAGRRLTWTESSIRFAGAALSFAAFGIGYLAALVDPERRTWHDRFSGTRLVMQRTRPQGGA